MALVGTISGSNGTSNTAVTGTLVIANTSSGFPQIPSDSVLYVEGRAVSTSDIVSSGSFRSMNSVGLEGGELFLSKAASSTTIDTGVTFDIYGDKLRVFETGGSNRGGYWDITTLAIGVGTNLAAGASPGGSDSYVQFNDASSFGGQPDFRYDKSTSTVSAANLFVTGSGNSLVTSGNIIVKDAAGLSNVIITPTGDITGSNLRLTGDVAVVGGDITSTTSPFNLVNGGIATVNFAGGASSVNIGAASSVTALAGDLNIGGGGSKARFGTSQQLQMLWNTNAAIVNNSGQFLLQQQSVNNRLELQISGTTAAGMFRVRSIGVNSSAQRDLLEVRNDGTIMIGSASTGPTFFGNTTINNDLFLATGIIGVSNDTTPIQLVSSGNVTIKLDANNNAPGHYFAVVDNSGANEFVVNENGNVDVTGNLVVTGSTFGTATTTTFNLLNTTLTGTLNVGGATQRMNFGGITSTGSFAGELLSDGNFNVGLVSERLFNSSSAGGIMNFSVGPQTIFYVNNPTSDITANFTSVPTTNLRVITPTVILSQSATPRNITAVRIENVNQSINWAGGSSPTVTANRQEVFGFSLIRSGSAWKVLGQMTSYG